MAHEKTDLERAEDAITFLDPNDRDNWVKMAFAVKSEFGEDGFNLWDQWSQSASTYREKDARAIWKTAKAGGKVGIGTLFFQAKERGWKDDSVRKQVSAEEIARRAAERAQRDAREAAELEIQYAAARERSARIWESASECTEHPYLTRKQVKSHGLRVGVWEVVDEDTGEVRTISSQALLVPIRDAGKQIHSLQAIFPAKVGKRDKDYLKGGAKSGHFYSMGKPVTMDVAGVQRKVILMGEGYATMATAHELTGHAAIVTFDAGNIPVVARVLREKFPEALFVYLADNDQWTEGNPGITNCKKAAAESGGVVAVPHFAHDLGKDDGTGKIKGPTDFNDLFELSGGDAVRDAIAEAINPPESIPEPDDNIQPWEDGPEPPPFEDSSPAGAPPDTGDEAGPASNGNFRILGYNRGTYFIFQYGKRQIAEITKGDMSEKGLIELAPLNWWEIHFPGERTKIDTNAAAEFIIRTAERRGIYDQSRVRGRGAWVDQGRMIYHHGDYLSVDGKAVDVTGIDSRYVYEMDRSLPAPSDTPLTDAEGQKILDLAKCFRWSKPCSAALMAGWVALAPMCGALKWRPHVWLTGGAGCGKSTVLNQFAHHLLGGIDLYAQGNSSEAGIRQNLMADARPVLFDESESNEESDARRVQNVLSLIRQSSTESEAQTLKGTAGGHAMNFHIRSMFCLASIQVALKQQADIERLTVLALRPKRDDKDAAGTWARISEQLYDIQRDPELPARLFRRAMDLLPVTILNIIVFSNAAAEKFNSQRDGDQYGTLLAGAWSLISTAVATKAQAMDLINSYDWSEHRENNDTDEGQRALASLMGAHVRIKGGIEVTVYELVCAAFGEPTQMADVTQETADALLQRYGMKVRGDRLLLANNHDSLKRLMSGTTFEADYRGVLLRVEGADRNENKPSRFSGVSTKCFSLPIGPIVSSDRQEPAF